MAERGPPNRPARHPRALGRRGLLLGGGLVLAAAAPRMTWERRDRARGWLSTWDAQGSHRTATGGDQAAADWLLQAAGAMGANPSYEPFEVSLLTTRDAYLQVTGLHILGEALYDAPPTGADGVAGELRPLGAPAGRAGHRIDLTVLGPDAVNSPGFAALRQRADLTGLVIVTKGGAPGLAMLDAESFNRPYGPPTLLVTSFEAERLGRFAAQAQGALLVVTQQRRRANARNVVVRVAAREPGSRPLVVLTAHSAWYRAAGERGGALACWLEILRALMQGKVKRDVLLVAVSGHELGRLGLESFLAQRPGLVQGADWLVLGANIGAAHGRLGLYASEPALGGPLAAALAGWGYAGARPAPAGLAPTGEAGAVHRAGARYAALEGTGPFYHLPQDRWPEAVDFDAVLRIAAGCAQTVAGLAGLHA